MTEVCDRCGHPSTNHPYRHPFVAKVIGKGVIKPVESEIERLRRELRTAVADYMFTEGCSCCRGSGHDKHRLEIAKLLGVPLEDAGMHDGSLWADFSKFRTAK